MSCPCCKQEIKLSGGISAPIAAELGPLLHLKSLVSKNALLKAKDQGIISDEDDEGSQETANKRCAFYQCFTCKKPYFGGLRDCEQDMANEEAGAGKPEDLLCQDCLLEEIGAG